MADKYSLWHVGCLAHLHFPLHFPSGRYKYKSKGQLSSMARHQTVPQVMPKSDMLLPGLLGGSPLLKCHLRPPRPGTRVMDLSFSVLLCLILAPLAVGLAGAVLLRDGKPVFFVSERIGRKGKPFRLWKFRTMAPDPSGLTVSGAHVEMRITPLGRWMRRFRMDEIPQLWNILRGDMSFVGPRPPLRRYTETFPELYTAVLTQKPGVTGLATLAFQAHEAWIMAQCGSHEEADDVYRRRCVARKARLDIVYNRNQSISMDFLVVFQTIGEIFLRRGA